MTKLVNRAKMTTATTGTGAITLGSAVDGFQTFAAAGVVDADVVRYVIEDGDDFEIGSGTFDETGGTLTRTVSESSNAGSPINLSGDAEVYITAIAADIVQPGDNVSVLTNDAGYSTTTGTVTSVASGTGLTGGPITSSGTLSVATNGITDTLLRDSSALSVIGRSANTTGDPADIAAGTDHQVLRRSGTSLGFGSVALNQATAVTGTLPVGNGGTGITSFGTGVATWLGTPSSANLAAAVTDETGSGALVFATSPTLVTPVLGTPTSGTLSNCTVDGTDSVGFRNIPQELKNSAYTIVLSDSGKHIYKNNTTAYTWTIPANASVAFPVGTAITFVNGGASGNITIAITSDTMRLAGDGSTGSRTLEGYGVATAIKVASTTWIISGVGLT